MAKKKVFRIDVYELHSQEYEVELDGDATVEDAIEAYQNGKASVVEDEIWCIGVADRYAGEGMPDGVRSVELYEEYED